MTTTNPPARTAGGRPSMLAREAFPSSDDTEDFMAAAMKQPPEKADTLPKRDPAEVVAEVMLAAALTQPDPRLEAVRKRGAVVAVQVPGGEWLDPVRRAWRREVSCGQVTRKADGYHKVCSQPPVTYTFTAETQRSLKDIDNQNDRLFADVLGLGQSAVGFSPDIAWLPPDLVCAADHKLILQPPSAWMLSEAAFRLTGSRATADLTADEATRITPRLLRLSVRPGQDADAYLLKLHYLLAGEQTTSARPAVTRTVRDEPTLDRLHGMDEAVEWGLQLRDDLDAYWKGERPWGDVDGGVLLSGPPGTGKTTFARAVAATCGVGLVSGSYGAWLSTGTAHQGDLLKAMRQAFKEAKKSAPSILLIDEIDTFGDRARVRHNEEWHTEVVNTLLAEIDGVDGREGVVVVGACNHPDKLDPALVRAGRLDRHIRIGLPDRRALAAVFREHLGENLPGHDLDHVALLALGCTGADVERMVRGARRRAATAGRAMIDADLRGELLGEEARSEADMLLVSVHEAGHAVAGHDAGIPIRGISLRQTGLRAGGVHAAVDRKFLTATDVQDRLVMLLAGRAAEEVVLHRVTSGSGGSMDSDLAMATRLAAMSASALGLEEDHGLIWAAVPDREEDLRRLLADDPRLAALVRKRLAGAYMDALNLVERNYGAVLRLAERLRARIAMAPEDVADVLTGARCRS